jgi:hypothetical protein
VRITLLVLLACCETAAPPVARPAAAPTTPPVTPSTPPRCELAVLRLEQDCQDIRGGLSGVYFLRVASGEHAGKQLWVPYGERNPMTNPGEWSVATVRLEPRPVARSSWPNRCFGESTQPMMSVGYIEAPAALEAFPDEAAARAALARRCG